MLSSLVNCARIEPIESHTGTVIFCHGLGDSGEGVLGLFRELAPSLPSIRFLFPNAPIHKVTCNFGLEMRAWYDIPSLQPGTESITQQQDKDGILKSRDQITALIKHEKVPANRILLGGFSQGGALALATGLSEEVGQLAGIMCCSGYLPIHETLLKSLQDRDEKHSTPIRFFHGTSDTLVPMKLAELSINWLEESKCTSVTLTKYSGMEHAFCSQEQQDIFAFIRKQLA